MRHMSTKNFYAVDYFISGEEQVWERMEVMDKVDESYGWALSDHKPIGRRFKLRDELVKS